MKRVELYLCEICGNQYNDESKCEECEKSHKKPIEIFESKYLAYAVNHKGYPQSIDVKFDNGEIVTYRR